MSSTATAPARSASRFERDASLALRRVSTSLQTLLKSLPTSVTKEADLRKAVPVDKTLSWQVFTVANSHSLRSMVNVPGAVPMQKFLKAAKKAGAPEAALQQVHQAYGEFEEVVQRHAGDRTAFNSMLTAIDGAQEDEVVDMLHRRNMFRAASHLLGYTSDVVVKTFLLNETPENNVEMCILEGLYGFRLLRALPQVIVFSTGVSRADGALKEKTISIEPLSLDSENDGYLLRDFSLSPDLNIRIHRQARQIDGILEHGEVGNTGACNLNFGTVLRNLPPARRDAYTYRSSVHVDSATKAICVDTIVRSSQIRGARPRCEVTAGLNLPIEGQATIDGLIKIPGDFRAKFLGRGTSGLAANDIPNYTEMVRAAGEKLGWNLEDCEVWRTRIDYPMYNSTIEMLFDIPPLTPPS